MLYLGRLMELGEAETVFGPPQHPYTEALLSAVPHGEGSERPRIRLEGEIPSAADPPSGCVFHTRCPRYIGDMCGNEEPDAQGGRARPLLALPLLRRGAPRAAAAAAGGAARRRGRSAEDPRRRPRARRQRADGRGARAGAARAGRGARAPARGRRLPLRPNAIDGTAETRCPAVLGHEGAGVVEGVGRAWRSRRARTWRSPGCRPAALRRVPARPAAPVPDGLGGDGPPVACSTARRGSRATASRSTTTRSCRRSPTHASCPRRCCMPIPDDVPFEVAALVGCAVTTGTGAVWRTAGVRPGERVAVFGCGGVGHERRARRGRGRRRPDRRGRRDRATSSRPRCELGATHAVRWAGDAEETAERVIARQRRRRRLRDRGDRPARGRARRVPLHARARRGGADRHPARRRRARAARAVDPADGAARARLDLRLVAARARLPGAARRSTGAGGCRSTG